MRQRLRKCLETRGRARKKGLEAKVKARILGEFGAFAELLSDKRHTYSNTRYSESRRYQAFLPDSSLGFQVLPQILNLSEKLITLRR
jgi:hypothetical protein